MAFKLERERVGVEALMARVLKKKLCLKVAKTLIPWSDGVWCGLLEGEHEQVLVEDEVHHQLCPGHLTVLHKPRVVPEE